MKKPCTKGGEQIHTKSCFYDSVNVASTPLHDELNMILSRNLSIQDANNINCKKHDLEN